MSTLKKLGRTLKGLGKIALQSRPVSLREQPRQRPLIVMGNGPSLRQTLEHDLQALSRADLMAVNFAAISPEFVTLRPQYYILADPFFFGDAATDNLRRLHDALSAVNWPMTLLVPRTMRRRLPVAVTSNTFIEVQTFNAVGVEGFAWFEKLAYSSRLGMPRPRNVLIPAIMCGIALGYTTIYIVGADHSWMQTLHVDDRNHVVSVQPHFYQDDEKERARVYAEYQGYHLHDIIRSFYVAFRAYHRIAAYAGGRGIHILNATPDSFIDAFQRAPLP